MSLNRRQFIQASGIALCAASLPFTTEASDQSVPLPVPPLLESRRGQPVFLTLQTAHWAFTRNNRSQILSINGQYPGPTVRVRNGDNIKLIYSNRLNKNVAMTICGLQVAGSLLGGAPRLMQPGDEWAPVLPVRQAAATLWYRSSTPQHSAQQLYDGLVGFWLVEDEHSHQLPLPRHYGVDDFPLIIQDKRLDHFGHPEYSAPASGGFLGNTLFVNGVQNPYLQVSRGWIRLRLLNASNARRYLLQASDERMLYVIAGDQGLLTAPVPVRQLSLAPGERREILLDLSDGKIVSLITDESASLLERVRDLFTPSSVLSSGIVLTLKPDGLLSLVNTPLPEKLISAVIPTSLPTENRIFSFANTPGINGQLWDASRINVTTRQDSWERWTIHADQPQPFHLEGARFQLLRVNGAPPLLEDTGWKDTVWIDGQVELLVYFAMPSQQRYPLTYSSQIMELADRGSIGQILVNEQNN